MIYIDECVFKCEFVCKQETGLEGTLLLEKFSFEITFVLAEAGCNTQNITRYKHVTGKVKLTCEVINTAEVHLYLSKIDSKHFQLAKTVSSMNVFSVISR